MSKARKFKLGDHVSYENKRHKYSLTGIVIGTEGGHYIIETDSFQGNWPYLGTKDINIYNDFIPERFNEESIWGTRRTKSDRCVWEHSRGLKHLQVEYVYDQSGDTEDDI